MEAKDWIPVFISQISVTMTYWNVYIVVALGVVGYVTQAGVRVQSSTRKLLAGSWLLFSISNLYPLYFSQRSLYAIGEKLGEYQGMFYADKPILVVVCHLIFDIAILVYILRWGASDTDN